MTEKRYTKSSFFFKYAKMLTNLINNITNKNKTKQKDFC